MKTETLTAPFEGLKEGAANAVERAKNLSIKVGEKLDTTYDDVARGVRKIKTSAEDTIDDTRHYIKVHPLAAVAGTALGAFAIGVLTGYIVRGRRSS
jgi:ElaB/YqjD/DUF883 family membrane-anchored ribosome-binding protein